MFQHEYKHKIDQLNITYPEVSNLIAFIIAINVILNFHSAMTLILN